MNDVTVLLATRNGAHVLPRTLEGYKAFADDSIRWKLIVVDNGSSDETPQILSHYARELPLTVIYEARPGKNIALNAGLEFIEGNFIILTDDDAVPQTGFIRDWQRTLDEQPNYDVFGGTILPLFEIEPPDWLTKCEHNFAPLYSVRRLPDGPINACEIFGPNMAVRHQVFASGARFDETIGPNAHDTNYAMGSETEFCIRASRNRHQTWFASAPTVKHIVREHQVTLEFWKTRAYRLGRGIAHLQCETGAILLKKHSPQLAFAGHAWRLLRRFVLKTSTLNPFTRKRYEAIWEYHCCCGFQEEYYRRRALHLGKNTTK